MMEVRKSSKSNKIRGGRFESLLPPISGPGLEIASKYLKGIGTGMLNIRKPAIRLDTLARRTLKEISGNNNYTQALEEVKNHITRESLTANIVKVTSRVNKAGLDKTIRLLLAEEAVYGALLFHALIGEGIKGDDEEGIYQSVLRNVNGEKLKLPGSGETEEPETPASAAKGKVVKKTAAEIGDSSTTDTTTSEYESVQAPKVLFYVHLVDNVMEKNSIQLEEELKPVLYWRVISNSVSLAPGMLEKGVLQILNRVRDEGVYPSYVEKYFSQRNEVSLLDDGNAIKNAMVSYLRRLNLNITENFPAEFADGNYDEYFAMAYDHALKVIDGRDDPVTGVYSGSITDWDYSVDSFESIEEQGISRENIQAAGALYYVYELGEELAVFKLVDALILRWAAGALNIPQGPTASMLYRYYKLHDQRATAEERGMVYKRVLDIGNAKLISNAVVNEDFPVLWEKLLEEVVEYIQKSETSNDGQVSKHPIYQATRDLQYNLTSHMTGMAHLQVSETYAHLRESFDILGNAEIVDHFAGGPRKNMWTVIERLWQEEFNAVPNLSSLRTAAVEGNKIFQWIADFEQPSVTEDQFREFLESAEAYIIANSERQPGNGKGNGSFHEEEEDFESDDDFDDWED